MRDNVNIADSLRTLVPVRPFMINVLHRAEERLVEKGPENAPGPDKAIKTWDDVDRDRLIGCAEAKLWRINHDAMSNADQKKQLADVVNLCGMAYDTLEQREQEAATCESS